MDSEVSRSTTSPPPPRVFLVQTIEYSEQTERPSPRSVPSPSHSHSQPPAPISAEAEADQEGEEASDPSESLNHEHISQYLGVIAQILEQNNLAVADVFECDEHGLIFPQEFREGLRSIGLEKIEKAHVIDIIEALRFQGEKELCLHIEELDEILQGYREGRAESPEAEEEFDNRISLFGTGAGLNPTHGSEKSDNSNDLENLRGYIGRSGSVLSDEYNPFDSGVE